MSVIALIASVFLAFWLLASVGYLTSWRPLRRAVAPLQRFRAFGSWAMFAAGEGRKGAYGLAYRDAHDPHDPQQAWTTACVGHHWSWHVFLLDPRRSRTDAIHYLGRELHRHLQQPTTPAIVHEIAAAQARLRSYLQQVAPPPSGATREIRVIKQLGAGDVPDQVVICQFAG